jgi:hypothetical protein
MVNSQSSRHMKVFFAVQLSLNPLRGYGEPGLDQMPILCLASGAEQVLDC